MEVLLGDCLDHLWLTENDSIDALVTDPPAGISFMGKDWDGDKGGRDGWIAWLTEVMKECHRVLKPGAHGLVWAIPRTSHWTATALENAGFEIRDVVTHLFGTGFPKSLDISKAIDKAAGAKREVLGLNPHARPSDGKYCAIMSGTKGHDPYITAPSTDEAKQWKGFGTALKPASEHWVLIRKPISEKTVAANVLKHGVGGINIDGCRIGGSFESGWSKSGSKASENSSMSGRNYEREPKPDNPQGRFPANLVLSHNADCGEQCSDGCAVEALDEQSGFSSENRTIKNKYDSESSFGWKGQVNVRHNDSGGASRFFYCAKASRSERNKGLEGMPLKPSQKLGDGIRSNVGNGEPGESSSQDRVAQNFHPTVKSIKLMQYLIRLVTPPGGTVLDPFMGSGSTGVAAQKEGFEFLGIEQNEEYFAIAKQRLSCKEKHAASV